jgi:hypothetical protein
LFIDLLEKPVRICVVGAHSVTLTSPPVSLAPDLASLLRPGTDIKVKHGAIGLLKHLAYTAPARSSLSDAGIIKRLVNSKIFQPTSDMVEMVQVNAIGVTKHLCSGNGEFAMQLSSIVLRVALQVLSALQNSHELLRSGAAFEWSRCCGDGAATDPRACEAF